jgi:Chalcone isomerase-like
MTPMVRLPSFNATPIAIYSIACCAVFLPATSQKSFANTLVAPAAAAVTAPRDISQALDQARKLGQSRLVVFGFNIYDAKLWVQDGFAVANYTNSAFALELRYLRNFSGGSIADRSLKEMRNIGTVSDSKAQEWLDQMRKTFPDIKKGDQLIGIHRADGSASFLLNGKQIGEVRDPEFNRLFFGIWLSSKTSEPKMRRDLIGAATSESK